MPGGAKRGAGDRIVESRHLVGLFLGVVLLCGVFFTLGYVMGRTQYPGPVHAEEPDRTYAPPAIPPKANDPDVSTNSAASGSSTTNTWDFYSGANRDTPLLPETKEAAPAIAADPPPPSSAVPGAASRPALTPVKSPTRSQPSRPAKPSYSLQVAALSHQSDAYAEAELLQHKHFPAFVVKPSVGEKLYRVQVGPYPDEPKAEAAKTALDHAGFKAIIRH